MSAILAHGGVGGALAEALVGIAVVGVFAAIWIRERSARKEQEGTGLDLTDGDR